jgi:hypothetical protein
VRALQEAIRSSVAPAEAPPPADSPAAPIDAAPSPARRSRARHRRRRNLVLVDGSNVAHISEGGVARLANLRLVAEKLRDEGFEPVVVADAALRHQIDDAEEYERMIERGEVQQAPAGTDADWFILNFARELGAKILSNDRFRDRIAHFPELRRHVIRYMIVAGEVVLERRTSKRAGGAS